MADDQAPVAEEEAGKKPSKLKCCGSIFLIVR